MSLSELLAANKKAILDRWFQLVLDTYPADTSQFLRSQTDAFANPVGRAIAEGIGEVFDSIVGGEVDAAACPYLEQTIRIRAVQDFPPSHALSFIFGLKLAVRDTISQQVDSEPLRDELTQFDARVDRLILGCFDIYATCRDKIHHIRADEVRKRTFTLLEQANLVSPVTECDEGPGTPSTEP